LNLKINKTQNLLKGEMQNLWKKLEKRRNNSK
jgi:hypothetical protein